MIDVKVIEVEETENCWECGRGPLALITPTYSKMTCRYFPCGNKLVVTADTKEEVIEKWNAEAKEQRFKHHSSCLVRR